MPYYILHMNMDAHPYAYHRNICIQHSVHEVADSQYPGKKRLYIRIYCDRTTIFIAMYTLNKNSLHLKSCYLLLCIGRPQFFVTSSSNTTSAT
jgi:hypothetical protein